MVTKIEVVYYARCSQTGEIWETADLKTLYHCVRYSFRCNIHYTKDYDFRCAVLRYGIVIHDSNGSCRYESLRDEGFLFTSGCDGKISTCEFERWYDDVPGIQTNERA